MQAQSIIGYNPEGRPELDFYPTPTWATEALLDRETFSKNVWEPACGDGAISKVLLYRGYHVFSSDIHNYYYGSPGIDFLKTYAKYADSIVTNPPFNLLDQFIQHTMIDLRCDKLALLARLAALEGISRSRLLVKTGLTRVHIFSKRLTFYRNGIKTKNSGMIAYAWFVWEKGNINKPVIDWI